MKLQKKRKVKTMTELMGIDVSVFNGNIDWEKLAGKIGFAILRAGYGMFEFQKDAQFERNYNECKRLGIPVRSISLFIRKNRRSSKKRS